MLTEIYIEALLVDEELADQVWDMWNAGVITDDLAAWAWWRIRQGSGNELVLRVMKVHRSGSDLLGLHL